MPSRPRHFSSGAWNRFPRPKGIRLNARLPIASDGVRSLEVHLLCAHARVTVELEGTQHLSHPVVYRRDPGTTGPGMCRPTASGGRGGRQAVRCGNEPARLR